MKSDWKLINFLLRFKRLKVFLFQSKEGFKSLLMMLSSGIWLDVLCINLSSHLMTVSNSLVSPLSELWGPKMYVIIWARLCGWRDPMNSQFCGRTSFRTCLESFTDFVLFSSGPMLKFATASFYVLVVMISSGLFHYDNIW